MFEPLIPTCLTFSGTGVPWSKQYADVYHSADGGPEQALHVFLLGNDLPNNWRGRDRFVILETGFGTGLNFLATWAAWRADQRRPRRLHYLSLEKHPFRAEDLATLHARWPAFANLSSQLGAAWPTLTPGFHRLEFEAGRVILILLFGDAASLLPQVQARVDAFYLDGFSPARNPDLWSPEIFTQLGRKANTGATLATWSVAGSVRRGLEAAGFRTEKRPGFGHKREMLTGRFTPRPWQMPTTMPATPIDRRAIVIGAGLAGTACCERLAARGWQITLIDRHPAPAQEASGNLAGIVMPLVSRDDNIASRLSRAAYLHAVRTWPAAAGTTTSSSGPVHTSPWSDCGVLQLARDSRHEAVQRALVGEMGYPPEFVRFLSREEAEARIGHPLPFGGWLFSQGGWAHPPGICRANLARAGDNVTCQFGRSVHALVPAGNLWQALSQTGELIAEAAVVILASGAEAGRLCQASQLPLQRIRGQVSLVPEGSLPPLPMALCREGYATPASQGFHAVGASYDVDDDTLHPRAQDNQGNLTRLDRLLPGAGERLDPKDMAARVGFRAVPPDRLPLVGALPDYEAGLISAVTQLQDLPRHRGLYAALGYASRGLVWSVLMAEVLACEIEGEPLPIEKCLADAIDPGRYLLKALRKSR
jgi:tRNA 5-methylaminomethyl-2-thiouridine biosynthesis bifunctional protein